VTPDAVWVKTRFPQYGRIARGMSIFKKKHLDRQSVAERQDRLVLDAAEHCRQLRLALSEKQRFRSLLMVGLGCFF